MDNLIKKIHDLLPIIPVEVIHKIVELVKAWLAEGIVINGKNRVMIEGYVTKLKFDPENKCLKYALGHVSTSVRTPDKYFPMYIDTFFYNKAAEELSKRIYEGMYVETEAKLRGNEKVLNIAELASRGLKHFKYTEYQLIGTHITGALQIKKNIILPEDTHGE